MRKMTLGPAKDFYLHIKNPVTLPTSFNSLAMPLREIWSGGE